MDVTEEILRVSAKGLKRKHGCSMDFGGSVIKMVYTRDAGDDIDLHLVSFPRAQFDDAFLYLKDKTSEYIKPGQTIDTCGVGCNEYKSKIKEALGVDINNQSELDCFVDTFRLLTGNMPENDVVHPPSQVAKDYVTKMLAMFQGSIKRMEEETSRLKAWEMSDDADSLLKEQEAKGDTTGDGYEASNGTITTEAPSADDDHNKQVSDATADYSAASGVSEDKQNQLTSDNPQMVVKYPCLLLMCGSAGAPMKVESDGTYQSLDILPMLGRSFLGLGCMLTGSKTFGELMDCVNRGDSERLDVLGHHLKNQDESDFYSNIPDDIVIYSSGHTVGKMFDDVNKDDLAASLLATICFNAAQVYTLWAMLLDIKNVYFCGSFVSGQKIRDEISKVFLLRSSTNPFGKSVDHYFLRHGAYLGCIGALFMNLNREETTNNTRL